MSNPDVMKMWAEALESDKFQQVVGLLHCKIDNKTYNCCLGVLCNLYMKHNPASEARWVHTGPIDPYGRAVYKFVSKKSDETPYYECSVYLPQEVSDWAGLYSTNPSTGPQDQRRSFVHLNDVQKLNFKDIATIIRAWEI